MILYPFYKSVYFIGELNPMILRDINDHLLLIPVIFLLLVVVVKMCFCLWVCLCVCVSICFPSLGFDGLRLSIFCVFMGVVNFLGLEYSF